MDAKLADRAGNLNNEGNPNSAGKRDAAMDENQAVFDDEMGSMARLSQTEQMLRSVLIVGCALGIILGLAFSSLIIP